MTFHYTHSNSTSGTYPKFDMDLCKKMITSALIIIGENAYNGCCVVWDMVHMFKRSRLCTYTRGANHSSEGQKQVQHYAQRVQFLIYFLKLSLHFTLCVVCIGKALGGCTQTVGRVTRREYKTTSACCSQFNETHRETDKIIDGVMVS